MKRWSYAEPDFDSEGKIISDTVVTLTEDEIIDIYFLYWSCRMIDLGKEELISEKNCIDDFIVINGCWEEK